MQARAISKKQNMQLTWAGKLQVVPCTHARTHPLTLDATGA